MKFDAWVKTDVGNVRDNNEDNYFSDPEHGVFAVADGVGGRERGDVASTIVIRSLRKTVGDLYRLARESDPLEDIEHRERVIEGLREQLQNINGLVFEQSRAARGTSSMASTADVLMLSRGSAYVGHVGDSRIYMIRDGRIFRITEDHTYAEHMRQHDNEAVRKLADGDDRYSSVLTRSIGTKPTVDIDTLFLDVLEGDRFILCSDGLTDYLSGAEVLEFTQNHDGQELVDRLVSEAKSRGGHDNITVVAVDVTKGAPTSRPSSSSMDTIRKVSFLEKIDLFQGLRPLELVKVLRVVYERHYEKGDVIIRRDDPADSLYLIADGAVSLEIQEQELTRLQSGQHFGELALFDEKSRAATARCLRDSLLLAVPSDEFHRLVEQNARLGRRLLWNLLRHAADQIRHMNERVVYEFGDTLEIESPNGD